MKSLALLLLSCLLSSFAGVKTNNSLNEYHLKGKVKSITEYNLSKGRYRVAYQYFFDSIGNITRQNNYDSNDSLFVIVKWDYKYDNNGRKTEENIYNADGTVSWKTVFNYDQKERLTETNRPSADGKLMEKVIYKYDANNNNTKQVSYDGKGEINCTSALKYDAADNLIEDVQKAGKVFNDQGTNEYWTFNNNRVMIKYSYLLFSPPGDTLLQDYSYYDINLDTAGNWIKKTTIEKYGTIMDTSVYKREISYY